MTLSGYLFAKLLDGKAIHYAAFLWNRALRLLPLLLVVVLAVGIMQLASGSSISNYAWSIVNGVWRPTLPNGGWSITIEFHYYLILPLFLWLLTKSRLLPVLIIVAAIAVRFVLHSERGEVQSLAYWTIIGRIDQFALGMLVYQFRSHLVRRHAVLLLVIAAFMVFYWIFDLRGGFLQSPAYPSPSRLWIFLPTIEGVAYAVAIAWYEGSFSHPITGVSKFVGRIGEYSYSIYLLQFFVVFRGAQFVHERVMDISNFYVACVWAVVLFVLMMLPGYASYRFIEAPFLRLRKRYVVASPSARPEHLGP